MSYCPVDRQSCAGPQGSLGVGAVDSAFQRSVNRGETTIPTGKVMERLRLQSRGGEGQVGALCGGEGGKS